MSIIHELKRRNVIRVGAAYVVTAWLLIQVAETIFPLFGMDDTPARLTVIILAAGFLPTLALAWVFEWTPEGLRKESELERSTPASPGAEKKLDRAIMAVLALGVLYFSIDKFVWTPQQQSSLVEEARQAGAEKAREEIRLERLSNNSIAVLPFVTRSDQQQTSYFADGVHDDLLTLLANIGSLRVISRTSVLQYRGDDRNLREIGEELGARTILEGGIQQAGQNVRINMQLIDARTDEHLWAQTFDRELTLENVFAIQSEIAEAVAAALEATLSPREQQRIREAPTIDFAAHEAFIKGRQQLNIATFAAYASARDLFQKAIDLDPAYTQARIGLADAWLRLARTGAIDPQLMLENGWPHIERATSEAPNDGYGLAVLGRYQHVLDTPDAEQTMLRGIQLNPNSVDALHLYAEFLQFELRYAEALDITNRALELDPLSVHLHHNRGRALISLGRFDEAQLAFNRIAEINPGNPYATHGNAMATMLAGQLARAAHWSDLNMDADPDDYEISATITFIYIALQKFEIARDRLNKSLAIGEREPYPMSAHAAYLMLTGNRDRAVEISRTALVNDLEDRWGSEAIFLGVVQRHAIETGSYEEALGWFRREIPECFEETPQVDGTNVIKATDLAHLLMLSGETERARVLLETIERRYKELYTLGAANFPLGIAGVDALALQGKKAAALSELRKMIDDGFRINWQLYTRLNANHRSLHGDPEYESMVDGIEADIAQQLEEDPVD